MHKVFDVPLQYAYPARDTHRRELLYVYNTRVIFKVLRHAKPLIMLG